LMESEVPAIDETQKPGWYCEQCNPEGGRDPRRSHSDPHCCF
jgi:hypothetical protein